MSTSGTLRSAMPTISKFYGVVIRMYWTDHPPPHFHARYAGDRIAIDITTLEVISGWLPPRALALTLEWASLHRDELLADWYLCRMKQTPKPIPPLD
jgi:hypothetical protein